MAVPKSHYGISKCLYTVELFAEGHEVGVCINPFPLAWVLSKKTHTSGVKGNFSKQSVCHIPFPGQPGCAYGMHFPWLLLAHLEHRKDNVTPQGRSRTGPSVYEELKSRSKKDLNHVLLALSCKDLLAEFACLYFCNYSSVNSWVLASLHHYVALAQADSFQTWASDSLKLLCTVWLH